MTENKEEKTEIVESWIISEIVCSQEKTYEVLEKQRRDDATRSEIECIFVPRATNESRYIISLHFSLE